ncbi:MAG TPA: ABC transporter permease [Vicinamibacterales bacterium]|nr:ABC transporter permease [Vicinamibacterales bacterium]
MMRGPGWLEAIVQDLRFGARMLRHSTGFTVTTVLLLALGIGANTAIFSVISSVFLRPLPFANADRLVLFWEDFTAAGGPARVEASLGDYSEWKARSRSVADMAVMTTATYSLTGSGEPEKVSGVRTTSNLFDVLGMRAIAGRTLLPADEAAGASPVVVISERFWRTRFGADANLVGRELTLNGARYTVAGVIAADFLFPNPTAVLWMPAHLSPTELADRFNFYAYVIARLKPGISLAQAQSEMTAVATQLAAERHAPTRIGITVATLREHVTRDATRPTLLLVAGAFLILLITCANVAGLLLAHGTNRRGELAVRNVLGAGGRRLVRQLLTESVMLAGGGAALGVGLATLTFGYLRRLVPPGLPANLQPELDVRVLAFTVAVTALVVLTIGTLPTLVAVRFGLDAVLRSSSRRVTGHTWSRHVLVVGELALTVVLLASAGLLLRSYANVLAAGAGFNPENLLLAETTLSPARYASPERRAAFYDAVLDRVRALPGVHSAAYVNFPPLVFKGGRTLISLEGQPPPPPSELSRYITSDRVATAGYFSTLEVPIVQGREFDRRDVAGSQLVAIINEKMARARWPGENPIGRRLTVGPGGATARWTTVVGVVADIRQMGLDIPPEAEVYFPASQLGTAGPFLWPQSLVIRTTGNPSDLTAAVRKAVWSVDPEQPVANVRTMGDVFDAELLARNTQLTLVSAFALLALAIAVVGLYGLLAYGVSQRVRDIGVRMALGARRATVVTAITRQSLLLVGAALAIGFAGAFASTQLLRSWLFDVSPGDPLTFAITAVVLLIAAMVACIVPGMRAASIEPAVILRAD